MRLLLLLLIAVLVEIALPSFFGALVFTLPFWPLFAVVSVAKVASIILLKTQEA